MASCMRADWMKPICKSGEILHFCYGSLTPPHICYHLIALHRTMGAEAPPLTTYGEVRNFLLRVKLAVASDRTWHFIDREKNLASMAQLGLIHSDVVRILRELTPEDYSEGPLDDDRGRDREWWVFGASQMGKTLYIKIAVTEGGILHCLSLHEAEYLMNMPLKDQGGQSS